jgi:hypothetical protein
MINRKEAFVGKKKGVVCVQVLGMDGVVSVCYKGQYSTLDLSYKNFLMSRN